MMTKEEFVEVMHYFFDPLYMILGGLAAVIIITLAVVFVIKPFIRRV